MIARIVSRYWLLVPLLLLAIVIRDFVETTPLDIEIEQTLNMSETKSDYYLEDFKTRKYDQQGVLEYQITGASLAHYPTDDRSEIKQPLLILHKDDVKWHIKSETGQLLRNPDVFTLHGEVLVDRDSADGKTLNIRTSELSISPEGNQVHTQQAVDIISDTWQLHSIGLHSTIDTGKLTLLSSVTGHYEVAKKK